MEFFNDMLREMTGYGEDELRRGEVCSIDPLILPDDRATVVEIVKRSTAESRPFQVDYRITHRDGSTRHFSEQGRPVPGADGRPECIDGVIFDVTEVRLSTEIVRLNQERLAEAQRISHVGSWLWDIGKGQSFWSAELYRILGLVPDSVPPTEASFLARVHPDDRAHFEARVAEAMRNRRSYDFDLRVVRPDGVERFAHGETKVEYDAAGEPALLTGICQDVTERRQAELALRASEERYRQLIEEMGEGVSSADANERFTFANRAAEELFGVPRGGLIGRSVFEFLDAEQAEIVHKQTARRRTGAKDSCELAITRPDGTKRIALSTATPKLDAAGVYVGSFAIFRDITARRQAEQQARAERDQLLRILDAMPDGAYVVGQDCEPRRQPGVACPQRSGGRPQVLQKVAPPPGRGLPGLRESTSPCRRIDAARIHHETWNHL